MKIGAQRFLFTESFSYKIDSKKNHSWQVHAFGSEILKAIPGPWMIISACKLVKGIRYRIKWQKNPNEYLFDERFSYYRLTLYTVNMIGLSILLIPVKFVATYLKHQDVKKERTFENPHFLPPKFLGIARQIQINKDEIYKENIRIFPDEKKYWKKMRDRDQVKNPIVLHDLYEVPDSEDVQAEMRMNPQMNKNMNERLDRARKKLLEQMEVLAKSQGYESLDHLIRNVHT